MGLRRSINWQMLLIALVANFGLILALMVGSQQRRGATGIRTTSAAPPRHVRHHVAPYVRTLLRLSDSSSNDGDGSEGESNDSDWLADAAADATGKRGRSLRRGTAATTNNSNLAEQSIEELVAQAAREQREAADAEKDAERAKKREVLKRRADKEYEAYWTRQKSTSPQSEAATLRAYYSLRKVRGGAVCCALPFSSPQLTGRPCDLYDTPL